LKLAWWSEGGQMLDAVGTLVRCQSCYCHANSTMAKYSLRNGHQDGPQGIHRPFGKPPVLPESRPLQQHHHHHMPLMLW
jgi:hypothetical protein